MCLAAEIVELVCSATDELETSSSDWQAGIGGA